MIKFIKKLFGLTSTTLPENVGEKIEKPTHYAATSIATGGGFFVFGGPVNDRP